MAKFGLGKKKKSVSATDAYFQAKGVTVTMAIWAWAFTLWIPQAVFAGLSLVGLGATALYQGSWTQSVINFFSSNLLGIETDGSLLFFVPWLLVIAIGWGTLMGAILQYQFTFLSPLNGKYAALKYVTLIFALWLYAVPIANLFPWFTLYTLIVMRYPK